MIFPRLFLKCQPQTLRGGIIITYVCRQGVEVVRMLRSHSSPLSALLSFYPKSDSLFASTIKCGLEPLMGCRLN